MLSHADAGKHAMKRFGVLAIIVVVGGVASAMAVQFGEVDEFVGGDDEEQQCGDYPDHYVWLR